MDDSGRHDSAARDSGHHDSAARDGDHHDDCRGRHDGAVSDDACVSGAACGADDALGLTDVVDDACGVAAGMVRRIYAADAHAAEPVIARSAASALARPVS